LNVSAAGDINNLPTTTTQTPGGDRILVTTGGHFETKLGNLNFPVLNPDGTVLNCNASHPGNPAGCSIPESLSSLTPGSSPSPILLGHRGASLSNAGTAGLIVPKDLLQVGGSNLVNGNLVVSLFPFPFTPDDAQGQGSFPPGIFNLWIDSVELSFTATPEPSTLLLFGSGLAGLALRWRASRRTSIR
jgi:hypothetical protein